jgi:hypothetical protein
MTYLLYIGNQNFTKIHIEKGILLDLLLVQQKKMLLNNDKHFVCSQIETPINVYSSCNINY